jgi:hypothetical protein
MISGSLIIEYPAGLRPADTNHQLPNLEVLI